MDPIPQDQGEGFAAEDGNENTISPNRLRLMQQRFNQELAETSNSHPTGPDNYADLSYPELLTNDRYCIDEWEYNNRRQMQEIVENVFLGPYGSAARSSLDTMLAAGLTHVICVRSFIERRFVRPNHEQHFTYLTIELDDKMTQNIIPYFKPTIEFINDALAKGGKVLVHGNCGICRSATLVIAYVMNRFGVGAQQAFHFVQEKRFCVNPNESFMKQLQDFEAIYRAQHLISANPTNLDQGTNKRSLPSDNEEEEESNTGIKKVATESSNGDGMDAMDMDET